MTTNLMSLAVSISLAGAMLHAACGCSTSAKRTSQESSPIVRVDSKALDAMYQRVQLAHRPLSLSEIERQLGEGTPGGVVDGYTRVFWSGPDYALYVYFDMNGVARSAYRSTYYGAD